jgi:hypothetical protein
MKKVSEKFENFLEAGWMMRAFILLLSVYFISAVVLGIYWDSEPEPFVVSVVAEEHQKQNQKPNSPGYAMSVTLMTVADSLLNKNGGYITNDIFPPGVWLDNIANWEFGVLVQVRDLSRAMRKDFSRSQSQSSEDVDLSISEPQFHFDNNSWGLPDSEGEYARAIRKLNSYILRLDSEESDRSKFYPRADNLRQWLKDVETRLGSLSQRLSASVEQSRIAKHANKNEMPADETTSWMKIDDIFYETRGTAWALLHFFRAIEVDFHDVLVQKNAKESLSQIIEELEATQADVSTPIILNGEGFGFTANHSLIMVSYIAQANAAIIDLRSLLSDG